MSTRMGDERLPKGPVQYCPSSSKKKPPLSTTRAYFLEKGHDLPHSKMGTWIHFRACELCECRQLTTDNNYDSSEFIYL
jgi:hypothetical protein